MCAATQMAIAVHETLSPFMTEMREGLAAVKTEMATMKRNLRVMEGKVDHLSREVTTHKNQTTSGLVTMDSVNSSIESVKDYITVMKEDVKAMKIQLKEHKDSVAEELESLLNNQNTFDFKLDLLDAKLDTVDAKQDTVDSKQDILDLKQDRLAHRVTVVTSALEARILSNTTRELRRSAANHVTSFESHLASVNDSIRSEVKEVEKQLKKHKNFVADELQVVMSNQNTIADVLSNSTRELERSTENHVTTIASQLTSVNASIRNKLRMMERLIAKNSTTCETTEIDTSSCDEQLETLLNSQAELEQRVLNNITKELEMSAEYHVATFESTIDSKLTSFNASIRNELRKIERQIAKNCTASERAESQILSSVAEELEIVVNNQNTIELALKALTNSTKELERSGESHVTAIGSQLTSVDAGIRNELRKIERQITRNSTGPERVELEILSHEELLETLAAVNTSISGQVSYIKEDLGHISSSVDRVIDGLGECMVTGEQNCSSQPLEECTCDTPVEQNCPEPARPSLDDCQHICDLNCTCDTLIENCQMQEVRSDNKCGGRGWRRVVYLNMTDPNTNCPSGWQLLITSSKRICGKVSTSRLSCDSVFFPVSGGDYTSVCGSIRAYQYGVTDAFEAYNEGRVTTIEGAYVAGVSLTHGSPRQHIWTFAAGATEYTSSRDDICPCDSSAIFRFPTFVDREYFCESGSTSRSPSSSLHTNDPLWDGESCRNASCCSFNNPPYFTKELPSPTTDPIEARICNYDSGEDTPIEFIDLYVK